LNVPGQKRVKKKALTPGVENKGGPAVTGPTLTRPRAFPVDKAPNVINPSNPGVNLWDFFDTGGSLFCLGGGGGFLEKTDSKNKRRKSTDHAPSELLWFEWLKNRQTWGKQFIGQTTPKETRPTHFRPKREPPRKPTSFGQLCPGTT